MPRFLISCGQECSWFRRVGQSAFLKIGVDSLFFFFFFLNFLSNPFAGASCEKRVEGQSLAAGGTFLFSVIRIRQYDVPRLGFEGVILSLFSETQGTPGCMWNGDVDRLTFCPFGSQRCFGLGDQAPVPHQDSFRCRAHHSAGQVWLSATRFSNPIGTRRWHLAYLAISCVQSQNVVKQGVWCCVS